MIELKTIQIEVLFYVHWLLLYWLSLLNGINISNRKWFIIIIFLHCCIIITPKMWFYLLKCPWAPFQFRTFLRIIFVWDWYFLKVCSNSVHIWCCLFQIYANVRYLMNLQLFLFDWWWLFWSLEVVSLTRFENNLFWKVKYSYIAHCWRSGSLKVSLATFHYIIFFNSKQRLATF